MSSAVKASFSTRRNVLSDESGTFREQFVNETKYEIIRNVQRSPVGISHSELSNLVGIDRKNLRRYTKELINEGWLIREDGKRGKYFLGPKCKGDSEYASFLLPGLLTEKILYRDYVIVNKLRQNPRFERYRDFRDFLPYFLRTEKVGLERIIFEFSSKIGAIITYLIIQTMNPNMPFKEDFSNLKHLYDNEIENWLKRITGKLIPALPACFKEHIYEYVDFPHKPDKDFDEVINFLFDDPNYQLSAPVFNQVSEAYRSLYPLMNKLLNNINSNLPKEITDYKNHMQYIQLQIINAKSCDHDYNYKVKELLNIDGYKTWSSRPSLKHCKKCHQTIKK